MNARTRPAAIRAGEHDKPGWRVLLCAVDTLTEGTREAELVVARWPNGRPLSDLTDDEFRRVVARANAERRRLRTLFEAVKEEAERRRADQPPRCAASR